MTTGEARVALPPGPVPTTAGRYRCTPGEDLVTALLGVAVIGGLLTDAWAHTNIVETIESFFTPWHGLLYAGFAAIATWTCWLALRRRPIVARWWRDGWPVGYAAGAIGAIGFLAGGALDLAWHTVFGVEASLELAFSPSHLLLSFAAVLVLTSPVRSWWATGEGGLRAAAGVLSLALGTVFGSAVLIPFSAFTSTAPTLAYLQAQGSPSHVDAMLGIGYYLITTVVITVPLLMTHGRRPAPGAATVIVAIISLFQCATYELPGIETAGAVGAIAGAAMTDLALMRLDAVRGHHAPLRLPIAGGLFATLVWTGQLLGMHVADRVRWPAELITGSVVFAAVIGIALGGLPAASGRTA